MVSFVNVDYEDKGTIQMKQNGHRLVVYYCIQFLELSLKVWIKIYAVKLCLLKHIDVRYFILQMFIMTCAFLIQNKSIIFFFLIIFAVVLFTCIGPTLSQHWSYVGSMLGQRWLLSDDTCDIVAMWGQRWADE